jgi:hypothetical protein
MKQAISVALLAVGCLVGYALPHRSASAQTPAAGQAGRGQGRALPIFTIDGSKYPRAELGKAVVWTGEELRNKYVTSPNVADAT